MRRLTLLAFGSLLALASTAPVVSTTAGATPEAALNLVASVTAGGEHTCALLTSGRVWCWGDNASGQLGDSNLGIDSDVPVEVRNVADTGPLTGVTQIAAGDLHTCARLTSANAVCWGEGTSAQLGN